MSMLPQNTSRRIVARLSLRPATVKGATVSDLLHALLLIQHATKPTPDDGGHHEAAHEIATAAIKSAEGQ